MVKTPQVDEAKCKEAIHRVQMEMFGEIIDPEWISQEGFRRFPRLWDLYTFFKEDRPKGPKLTEIKAPKKAGE